MKADIVQTQDVAPKDHCSHKVPSTKHHLEKSSYWFNVGVKKFLPSSRSTVLVEETTLRCYQHPNIVIWLPRPVRALFPWVRWCSNFQLLAFSKIAAYARILSRPELKHCCPHSPYQKYSGRNMASQWRGAVGETVDIFQRPDPSKCVSLSAI